LRQIQMMHRRIMVAVTWWLALSVPTCAKYRGAVNRASMGSIQDEFVGV
jgi:hypothetical protein